MLRSYLSGLCGLAALFCVAGVASADLVIADSQLDFSNVQGQDNWYYGYYDSTFVPADFELMTQFSGTTWAVDKTDPAPTYWTSLYSQGGHPNGTNVTGSTTRAEQWSVRRYVSEVNGLVTLQGEIGDLNSGAGNGVIGHIFVDGAEVFTQSINNGQTGVNYQFDVAVSVGSIIDFAIDPKQADDIDDSTRFTATITAVPEPATLVLWALASLVGFVALRRRRK